MDDLEPKKKDRKPYVKPTVEEYEQRVAYAEFLLCRRIYKCDIKRLMKKKFNVTARAVEDYLSRAKEKLRDKSGKTRAEHQIDSLQFYESVLNGPDSTLRDRMDAQARIDKLLGLEDGNTPGGSVATPIINVIEQVVTSRDDIKGKADE
jgi:hypothetical protein